MTTIRNATHNDIERIVELGTEMFKESHFSNFTYNPSKVAFTIGELINDKNGIVLLAENDGIIVGGLVALSVQHWFGDEWYTTDLSLFISKEHRGNTTAPRLIKAYIEHAKQLGVSEIQIGISTGLNIERTAELFKKFGFKKIGEGFSIVVRKELCA